jgi:putative transposase
MKACFNLGIQQAFPSYNNPKGNADTERMIRTMKEELLWLREWSDEAELSKELDKWVEYYNNDDLHSAHGYRTSEQTQDEYYKKKGKCSTKCCLTNGEQNTFLFLGI